MNLKYLLHRLNQKAAAPICLAVIFFIYLLIGTTGYGNDCDSYLMLRSGLNLFQTGSYSYSRPPGYLLPEIIIALAAAVGGHILANAVSALLAVGALAIFNYLLRQIWPNYLALLQTLVIAANPYFVVAATTAMDYVYSLFFLLATFALLQRKSHGAASIAAAAAASSRLGNAVILALIFALHFWQSFRAKNSTGIFSLLSTSFVAALLSAALYLPSFFATQGTFSFLSYAAVEWSWFGHFSRFIYKNLYLLGLLPAAALTWLIFASRQGLKRKFSFDPLIITGLAAITLQMLLFFKIPLEISYQLPLLFIALPLLTYLFAFSGRNLLLLLGLTVIYAFVVNIDLLDRRYNADGTEAVSAAPGLFFRAGVVVNDIASRKESQKRYFDEYGIQLR